MFRIILIDRCETSRRAQQYMLATSPQRHMRVTSQKLREHIPLPAGFMLAYTTQLPSRAHGGPPHPGHMYGCSKPQITQDQKSCCKRIRSNNHKYNIISRRYNTIYTLYTEHIQSPAPSPRVTVQFTVSFSKCRQHTCCSDARLVSIEY